VQAHLDTCNQCRAEFEQLQYAREAARRLAAVRAPADLAAAIGARVDRVRSEWQHTQRWSRRRVLAWGSAAAAAALVVAYVSVREDAPTSAVRIFGSMRAGATTLDLTTAQPVELERFFNSRLPFNSKVYDLGMMNYQLHGGRVVRIAARATALSVYSGP